MPTILKPQLPDVHYILGQMYRDLFGKDVQETPTVSYVWMADQLGHFGLGFQITYLLGWIAWELGFTNRYVLLGLAVANLLGWVVKEIFDYLRELRKSQEAKSTFQFNGKEILWNVFTALFFIGIGCTVAGAAEWRPGYGIVAVAILVFPAFWMVMWWLKRKITFQQAGLPYLYRLATFPNDIDKATAEYIVEMSKPRASGPPPPVEKHLIISGPLGSGKSSLAVGIGTEFAFRMGIGRYTTLVNLLQSAIIKTSAPNETEFDDGRILWPWETSDLMIVDDVDVVSDRPPETVVELETALKAAKLRVESLKTTISPAFFNALKHRRTVWVVGDVHDGDLANWQAIIADIIGVAPDAVRTFDLTKKAKDALQARAMAPAVQVKQ